MGRVRVAGRAGAVVLAGTMALIVAGCAGETSAPAKSLTARAWSPTDGPMSLDEVARDQCVSVESESLEVDHEHGAGHGSHDEAIASFAGTSLTEMAAADFQPVDGVTDVYVADRDQDRTWIQLERLDGGWVVSRAYRCGVR